MGLAASQARMLLLTARKSDLEYRAQMICQSKTLLAMQTEELALNYSNALNNRALFYTYEADTNGGETLTELLTYDNLTSVNNKPQYRVVTPEGKILARSVEEANQKYKKDADKEYTADDVIIVPAAFNNANYFQNALQSGDFLLQECETEVVYKDTQDGVDVYVTEAELRANRPNASENEITEYMQSNGVSKSSFSSAKPISGMDKIKSRLDDSDDAQAAATYEYESLIIQNRDKQLDVELKQIETQQKACESEIDSVKKILQTNIEKSFKTFT